MKSQSGTVLRPGETIGGCVIEARIAAGGMATVYRACKEMLDKAVAVKVLHPEFVQRQDHLRRFLREAKVAAGLDHPGIVKVYDVGKDRGFFYIVMEFVEGKDLKSVVTDCGPLSPRKALRAARQAAEALVYAHGRGLIHRDIKPANLLMARGGEIKLADFGLARLAADDHEVTATGQILGTPAFMSPEQCRGDPLDARSDLYSLGATIYFLLSGRVPFAGEKPAALIHTVINNPPPPLQSIAPDVPEKVVTLVQRLMAKHPSSRFQSGQELTAAIDQILLGRLGTGLDTAAKPSAFASAGISWRRCAVLGFAALVLGSAVYFIGSHAIGFGDEVASADTPSHEGDAIWIGHGNERWASPRLPREGDRSQSPPAPFSQEEFSELQSRVGELLDHLCSGEPSRVLAYIDPFQEGDVRLCDTLQETAKQLSSYGATTARHRTSQGRAGSGRTFLSVSAADGKTEVQIVISWVRREGAWYVTGVSTPREE